MGNYAESFQPTWITQQSGSIAHQALGPLGWDL